MTNLIIITIDPGYLTQEQALIKATTMILNQDWNTLGKPIFELVDDDIAIIVEVEK